MWPAIRERVRHFRALDYLLRITIARGTTASRRCRILGHANTVDPFITGSITGNLGEQRLEDPPQGS
jgi:hypothetical protein